MAQAAQLAQLLPLQLLIKQYCLICYYQNEKKYKKNALSFINIKHITISQTNYMRISILLANSSFIL